MRLPPPDPNEPPDSEPDGQSSVPAPTIVFNGPPTMDAERVAAAILERRPGVLFVTGEQ